MAKACHMLRAKRRSCELILLVKIIQIIRLAVVRRSTVMAIVAASAPLVSMNVACPVD
jgi:hypothetical protein